MELKSDESLEDFFPVEVELEIEDGGECSEVVEGFTSTKQNSGRLTNPNCCPHCDYYTSRKDHFKRHVLRHPEQNLYEIGPGKGQKKESVCSECGYTTMRKDHFKRHMMRHTGEKPYSCLTCGYATTHSIHLKRHTLRSGHKPNPNKTSKNDIMQSVTDFYEIEWPLEVKLEEEESEVLVPPRTKKSSTHICVECGYGTSRSDHFKRHLRKHTGEKPFVCSICNFATGLEMSLKKHMIIHSRNNRPFICNLCPYSATQIGRLKTHLRKHDLMI